MRVLLSTVLFYFSMLEANAHPYNEYLCQEGCRDGVVNKIFYLVLFGAWWLFSLGNSTSRVVFTWIVGAMVVYGYSLNTTRSLVGSVICLLMTLALWVRSKPSQSDEKFETVATVSNHDESVEDYSWPTLAANFVCAVAVLFIGKSIAWGGLPNSVGQITGAILGLGLGLTVACIIPIGVAYFFTDIIRPLRTVAITVWIVAILLTLEFIASSSKGSAPRYQSLSSIAPCTKKMDFALLRAKYPNSAYDTMTDKEIVEYLAESNGRTPDAVAYDFCVNYPN